VPHTKSPQPNSTWYDANVKPNLVEGG
jgi:hypothetical protein